MPAQDCHENCGILHNPPFRSCQEGSNLLLTHVEKGWYFSYARKFGSGGSTTLGRVLEGLVRALTESSLVGEFSLATHAAEAVPPGLRKLEKIKLRQIPEGFLKSEKALRDLSSEDVALYVSPYPKLPLRGCHCKSVHIVHDVSWI
ncbi:MAG: hypothetical protein H8D55_03210 [Deltaproteobacteria bacterium]|nr:hypothetical protein [Deltaproteobacteria bacterium]